MNIIIVIVIVCVIVCVIVIVVIAVTNTCIISIINTLGIISTLSYY